MGRDGVDRARRLPLHARKDAPVIHPIEQDNDQLTRDRPRLRLHRGREVGMGGREAATSVIGRPVGAGDSARPRKLLVIASRFPPVASVGAIRIRKFVKYLREHRWESVVVTGAQRQPQPSSEDARRACDLSSLQDVPADLEVHRLGPNADDGPRRWSRELGALIGIPGSLVGCDAQRCTDWLAWRMQALGERLAFPDRGIWRTSEAVRLAVALHRRHAFDAIFSSGMPFSDHVIALQVQARLRRPWVADFRDPWVEYIHWPQWTTRLGAVLTRLAEAAVIWRAAAVVSVNDHMTRRFSERYRRAAGKFVTIENGFDPGDFPAAPQAARREFQLLYAGSLYGQRGPDAVLAAFRRFVERTPGSASHARFDFLGRVGPFADRFDRAEDAGRVRYLGMKPHREAMEAMASASANVVLLPRTAGGEGDSTAKIYECIGIGRPILAVVPSGGEAARLLEGMAGAQVCEPDDAEAISRGIGVLYTRWLAGADHVSHPADRLMAMTRQYQAGCLAGVLNRAVGRRAGKGAV
jgi:glycosyltransferase involved in cell wall biosynthesis